MPVMCVVRITAPDILVISAFCRPMMKHSSITATVTKRPGISSSRAPTTPKASSSSASTSSGSAYSLCSRRCRAALTMIAVQAAPARKDSTAAGTVEHQGFGAEHQVVGHRRDDARHVGRVLLHREEAAGIDRTGDEGQGRGRVGGRHRRCAGGP